MKLRDIIEWVLVIMVWIALPIIIVIGISFVRPDMLVLAVVGAIAYVILLPLLLAGPEVYRRRVENV